MRCYIGVGGNLGDRRANLESAALALSKIAARQKIRLSPIYENPALIPLGAPDYWNLPFLNAVVELDWNGSADELLCVLKRIEYEIGRRPAERWAPRCMDLDLLLFGDAKIDEANLQIPHVEMLNRHFVLDPLKDLAPMQNVQGKGTVVSLARRLIGRSPLVMSILNLTPDSFSDGEVCSSPNGIVSRMQQMEEAGVQMFDLGAESTRPGATPVSIGEELRRLEGVFAYSLHRSKEGWAVPRFSVDTRNSQVASRALSHGFQCINDVSGLADPQMLAVLRESTCDYVLTHSLSVPAESQRTLPMHVDPVTELKRWLEDKMETLSTGGVDLGRIIFDPGLGFGKTRVQSRVLADRIAEFAEFDLRILVGHSRKSFLLEDGIDRDVATLAMSKDLVRRGVDILRVHDYQSHLREFTAKAPRAEEVTL